MNFLYRIPSNYCGYHSTDIAVASYIHTKVNTLNASGDASHNQADSLLPEPIHKHHSSVHREYHCDTNNLRKTWDVHQPR